MLNIGTIIIDYWIPLLLSYQYGSSKETILILIKDPNESINRLIEVWWIKVVEHWGSVQTIKLSNSMFWNPIIGIFDSGYIDSCPICSLLRKYYNKEGEEVGEQIKLVWNWDNPNYAWYVWEFLWILSNNKWYGEWFRE